VRRPVYINAPWETVSAAGAGGIPGADIVASSLQNDVCWCIILTESFDASGDGYPAPCTTRSGWAIKMTLYSTSAIAVVWRHLHAGREPASSAVLGGTQGRVV